MRKTSKGWPSAAVAMMALAVAVTVPASAQTSAPDPAPDVVFDLVFVGLTLVFFALSVGYVALCDRLMK